MTSQLKRAEDKVPVGRHDSVTREPGPFIYDA